MEIDNKIIKKEEEEEYDSERRKEGREGSDQ